MSGLGSGALRGFAAALLAGATVFAIPADRAAAQPTLTTLYSFSGTGLDGGSPQSTLVFDAAGNLYGTSELFGAGGYVFELSPPAGGSGAWSETTLYGMRSLVYPPSSLAIDAAGNLYGTSSGGYLETEETEATIFRLSPPAEGSTGWSVSILHSFGAFFALPGRPVLGVGGNIFAMSAFGGKANGGAALELSPTPGGYVKTVVFNFPAGSTPLGGLVADNTGHYYGTTSAGGTGYGTVYALTLVPGVGWKRSVLYRFSGQADGAAPHGELFMDAAGNLYGTTSTGGSSSGGTAFELSPPAPGAASFAWSETTLYDFAAGSAPMAGLVMDSSGNLYGTTSSAGADGYGTVYELSPAAPGLAWTRTTLHRFTNGGDGGNSMGALTFDAKGNLYGTTTTGGASNAGTVFELTP